MLRADGNRRLARVVGISMKAILVARTGGPEVLQLVDVPVPVPGPGPKNFNQSGPGPGPKKFNQPGPGPKILDPTGSNWRTLHIS